MGKSLEQSFNEYISKVEKELGYKITKEQRKQFMYCFVAGAETILNINNHVQLGKTIDAIQDCKNGNFESFNK